MNIGTRKMQIKTTIRGHNISTRLSISIGENLEKLEYSHIIDVTVKWFNSFRKLVIHQNMKHSLFLNIYSKEGNLSTQNFYTNANRNVIHNRKTWNHLNIHT